MKLEFYTNPKMNHNEVSIGKTGQLRFKQKAAKEFGIEKGQRWKVGIDSSEKKYTAFYLIKTESDDPAGFKIAFSNAAHHMCLKGFVDKINLKVPVRCKYEKIMHEGVEIMKIIFPKV